MKVKKNKMFKVAVAVVALLLVTGLAYGDCGACGGHPLALEAGAQEVKAKGIINDVCPVMGGKVAKNTQYTADYQGNKVGFCCAGCIGTFNANTEKYLEKLGAKEA